MRILFLHHFPERESVVGRLLVRWAEALAGAGHEVRLLVVDATRGGAESLPVDRVVCDPLDSAAELKLDLPRFSQASVAGESTRFHQLTDEQLNAYRDVLRRRLDAHIDRFDPHHLRCPPQGCLHRIILPRRPRTRAPGPWALAETGLRACDRGVAHQRQLRTRRSPP